MLPKRNLRRDGTILALVALVVGFPITAQLLGFEFGNLHTLWSMLANETNVFLYA